jgi:ABC-2 type transport system permease protein
MTALLHAELLKLRTTRTFVALTGLAVLTSLVITALISLLTEPTEESVLVDVFTTDTSSLFILVLAVIGISGEWRHRTIASSLLAAPERARFLAAKTLAFAAAGLVMSVAIMLAVALLGVVLLSVRDLPLPEAGEWAAQVARNGLLAALLGALGVGVGALVRHQVVAIVGLLVMMFLVEPAVLALAPEVGRFGPFTALPVMVQDLPPDDFGLGEVDTFGVGAATLLMLAWVGVAYAAAAALLHRRDLQ